MVVWAHLMFTQTLEISSRTLQLSLFDRSHIYQVLHIYTLQREPSDHTHIRGRQRWGHRLHTMSQTAADLGTEAAGDGVVKVLLLTKLRVVTLGVTDVLPGNAHIADRIIFGVALLVAVVLPR